MSYRGIDLWVDDQGATISEVRSMRFAFSAQMEDFCSTFSATAEAIGPLGGILRNALSGRFIILHLALVEMVRLL
jgi:hypothetical protein